MQTFLPHPDFSESAKILDTKRLGKQILECYQIMLANCPNQHGRVIRLMDSGCDNKTVIKLATYPDYSPPYRNHPAALMWRRCDVALLVYAVAMYREWRRRGYRSYAETIAKMKILCDRSQTRPPSWHGFEPLHASHRSNLLRKDSEFYGQYGWTDSPEMPYYWPVGVR